MPLTVVSFVTYLSNSNEPWRKGDFNAMKFVKAIKGEGVNGYAWVTVSDEQRHLTQGNAADAIEWFGEMAAEYIRFRRPKRPFVLVPVPSSDCTVRNKKTSRTSRLAKAIATRLSKVKVWPGLRWKKRKLSARKGGARHPAVLCERLTITKKLPKARMILIDDVYTSGGHLKAAAAKITQKGGRCILACASPAQCQITNRNLFRFSKINWKLSGRGNESQRYGCGRTIEPNPSRATIKINSR